MLGSSFLKSARQNPIKRYIKEQLAYLFFDNALYSHIKATHFQDNMIGEQNFFSHITLKSHNSIIPEIDSNSHIAHLAHLYGNVTVGKGVRVEPFSLLKATKHWIELCDNTYIGRYVSMNIRTDLPDKVPKAVSIGKGSIVEDRCVLTNVVLGENVWVEEGVVLQEGVVVQDFVRILPGSVIAAGMILESGKVYGGINGGDVIRDSTDQDLKDFNEMKEFTKSDLKMMDRDSLLKYYYINS